jgi:hypothetical protein
MHLPSKEAVEHLVQSGHHQLREALEAARGASNPTVAELADEVLSGRMTATEALASSTYRELLESRLARAIEYVNADEDERRHYEQDPDFQPPSPPGHPKDGSAPDDESGYEDFSVARRRR